MRRILDTVTGKIKDFFFLLQDLLTYFIARLRTERREPYLLFSIMKIPFLIVNHTVTMMLTIKKKSVNLFFRDRPALTGTAVHGALSSDINIKQKRKERRN